MDVNSTTVSNTVIIFDLLLKRFVYNLPFIFIILGLIGFIGNALTFLQSELRSNTCCIYSLCGSIIDIINLFFNLLTVYLNGIYGIYIPWIRLASMCKFFIFILGFLPNLSINFLLLSIIDQYACTCDLASRIRRLNQLKIVPWAVSIMIIVSGLVSTRTLILYEYTIRSGCTATQPLTNNILYIILNGFMQPVIMLLSVFLTFRNVRRSRQRVGGTATTTNPQRTRNRFISMIFTQVIATAFISLQWIIMYTYNVISASNTRTAEQQAIISFVFALTNYCFYLNNVKSFYISILTSRIFRKTFITAIIKFLPRHLRQRWVVPQPNISMMTVTKRNREHITPHVMETPF